MTRRSRLGREWMLAASAMALALSAPRLVARQAAPSANLQQAADAIKADRTAEGLDAVHRELAANPGSLAAANLLDVLGATGEAQRTFRAAIAQITDPAAKAQAQRALAMSFAFMGDCNNTIRNEQFVIDYWVTREAAEPQNAFYQEGEVANEAARVCIDNGNLDIAEQWYRKGTELGLKEPAPKTHPASLWAFRLAHALARLAARRGNEGEAARQVAAARRALDGDSAMAAQQERFFPYLTGYVALYTNDFTRAEQDLARAIATAGSQGDPFLLWLLATTYAREGRAADANATYRKPTAWPRRTTRPRPSSDRSSGASSASARRAPTCCAATTTGIARTTTSPSITSTCASIPSRSTSAVRTRFASRCCSADTRIQLDLYANLHVDKILDGATP